MNKPKKYLLLERFERKEFVIEELSVNQVNQLDNFHEALFELGYHSSKSQIIDLNINDYLDRMEIYRQQLEAKKPERLEEYYNILTDINRLFINILTSFNSYIEFIDKNLAKKYAPSSDEYKGFKTLTKNLYDRYFAYRFFYHLRNYSVHVGFPLQSFQVNYKHNKNGGKSKLEFRIDFDKIKLLKDRIIKKKLGFDLNGYNDTFPAFPLINEILICVKELEKKMFLLEYPKYLDARNGIFSYYMKSSYQHEVYYGENIDRENIKKDLKHKLLRIDIVRKFDELEKNFT